MARFKMKTSALTAKTTAGLVGGAIATVLVFVLNTFVIKNPAQKITPEVAAAFATIMSFLLSYLKAPSERDEIVPVQP
jgi:CDP-diglyceride synthetase